MSDGLRVTLDGLHQEIGAEAVHTALGALLSLAKDASKSIGSTAGSWKVSELTLGSATIVISNPAARGVGTLVEEGIDTLARAATVPTSWTQDMVKQVRRLGGLAGRDGVLGVRLGTTTGDLRTIDTTITNNAEAAIEAKETSIGRVVGKVDTWTERKVRQVGLTLDSGSTIKASYPESMATRVRDQALGERVELTGEIERNVTGQGLRIKIIDFEVLPATVPLPVSSILGLYADQGALGITAADVLEDRE
jgi:hypothetical protein